MQRLSRHCQYDYHAQTRPRPGPSEGVVDPGFGGGVRTFEFQSMRETVQLQWQKVGER